VYANLFYFVDFGVLNLVTHPDVQKKMQLEIDDVIGRERRPTLADRPK
jgi:hypothetical protein